MNTQELARNLLNALTHAYSVDEKRAMVQWLLESRLGLSRSQVIVGSEVEATASDFDNDIQRLNRGEPLQYILGYTEFRMRRFEVTPAVLIPRPETELMIDIALEFLNAVEQPTVWDIGTGSGCIAISLALELNNATLLASDTSIVALEIARANASRMHAKVEFIKHDILLDSVSMQGLDAMVSNPPYILRAEQPGISSNVSAFEPHQALFVPDEDPLLFHRVIAQKSRHALKAGGLLLLEINETLGPESAATLTSSGFQNVTLKQDLDGKDRFVMGSAPQ